MEKGNHKADINMRPRGLRNNNPGNLRLSKDKWKGLRSKQEDKDFFQFASVEYGYRALIITLQNYRRKHNCWNIRDFITRYAPPSENNTESYINIVCKKMGVSDMWCPNVDDKVTMIMFASAISYVENGVLAEVEDVVKGWELI